MVSAWLSNKSGGTTSSDTRTKSSILKLLQCGVPTPDRNLNPYSGFCLVSSLVAYGYHVEWPVALPLWWNIACQILNSRGLYTSVPYFVLNIVTRLCLSLISRTKVTKFPPRPYIVAFITNSTKLCGYPFKLFMYTKWLLLGTRDVGEGGENYCFTHLCCTWTYFTLSSASNFNRDHLG